MLLIYHALQYIFWMCQQQLNALKRLLRNERQTERREARLFAWRATDAPVPPIWCQSPDTDRLGVSHLRDNEIARATQTSADCTTPTLRQSLHLSETKPLRLPPSSSDPDTRYERTRLIKSPSTNVMERSGWKRTGRGAAEHLIGWKQGPFPSQRCPQVVEDVWNCGNENHKWDLFNISIVSPRQQLQRLDEENMTFA